jgi:histidine triad (HIT) family protein
MEDCVLCDVLEKKIPGKIIHEEKEIVAIQDINPQSPVHILILPRKHIPTLMDMTEADEKLIGKMVILASELAKKHQISEKGFRLVFNCNRDGGQSINHIHLHLLGGRRMNWPPG